MVGGGGEEQSVGKLCPPTKGEGLHISFSADPGHRRDSLYPPYFLNQWVEFYQTCM